MKVMYPWFWSDWSPREEKSNHVNAPMGKEKEEAWLHYTDDLSAAEAHTSNAGGEINGNSLDYFWSDVPAGRLPGHADLSR